MSLKSIYRIKILKGLIFSHPLLCSLRPITTLGKHRPSISTSLFLINVKDQFYWYHQMLTAAR